MVLTTVPSLTRDFGHVRRHVLGDEWSSPLLKERRTSSEESSPRVAQFELSGKWHFVQLSGGCCILEAQGESLRLREKALLSLSASQAVELKASEDGSWTSAVDVSAKDRCRLRITRHPDGESLVLQRWRRSHWSKGVRLCRSEWAATRVFFLRFFLAARPSLFSKSKQKGVLRDRESGSASGGVSSWLRCCCPSSSCCKPGLSSVRQCHTPALDSRSSADDHSPHSSAPEADPEPSTPALPRAGLRPRREGSHDESPEDDLYCPRKPQQPWQPLQPAAKKPASYPKKPPKATVLLEPEGEPDLPRQSVGKTTRLMRLAMRYCGTLASLVCETWQGHKEAGRFLENGVGRQC
eukprot:TRINITY_DN27419_c0_g1_i1.p1 TRINITY_DN27419_c0_g1~~TRINITY_DN27419_c0_g1_i1.p1  ORF type:complete len:352 (+),score=52.91 TRINITY_DN27419_c0_g1_i1:63-1118(+)